MSAQARQGLLFEEPPVQETWADFLARETGRPVAIRFGNARTSVIRYRRERTGEIRLHMSGFFEQAPREIRQAVAAWVRAGKRAKRAAHLLNDWIHEKTKTLAPAPRRGFRARTQGRVHDLESLAATLWLEFPALALAKPALTWGLPGPSARGRRRRTLRLGSYNERSRLVRVHPALDRDFVPDWFVRYILFHELLHAELGVQRNGGRRIFHGAEFRRRERAYADYARAIAWEKKNLRRLLSPS